MKTRILLSALAILLLGAQDCEPKPLPEPVNAYCNGTPLEDPSIIESTVRGYEQDGVEGAFTAIVGGVPAEDRLSAVYVRINGLGSCSGAIIGPHTVLLAGHCHGEEIHRVCLHATNGPCWDTTDVTVHPGYYRWSSERSLPHDDVMIAHFPNDDLPGPYPDGAYNAALAAHCTEIRAAGWGAWDREDYGATPPPGFEYHVCPDDNGDGAPDSRCLLQAEYRVNDANPSTPTWEPINRTELDVEQVPWGGKCFGDSGSLTWAFMDDGRVLMVGITSTVKSLSCVTGGTDVDVWEYRNWIAQNAKGDELVARWAE